MTDQESVEAKKAASAAGAADNSALGVDGDDASVADQEHDEQAVDPVTGTTGNAVGEDRAQENRDRESAS